MASVMKIMPREPIAILYEDCDAINKKNGKFYVSIGLHNRILKLSRHEVGLQVG